MDIGAIAALRGVGLLEGVATTLASRLVDRFTKSATPSATIDSAEFSPLSKALATGDLTGAASELLAMSDSERSMYMATLKTQIQENLAQFQTETGKLFSDYGVDTSREIVLKLDESGKIIVANDHPDKAQIESLFAIHSGLTATFQTLAKASGLGQAVATSGESSPTTLATQFSLMMRDGQVVPGFAAKWGAQTTPRVPFSHV